MLVMVITLLWDGMKMQLLLLPPTARSVQKMRNDD